MLTSAKKMWQRMTETHLVLETCEIQMNFTLLINDRIVWDPSLDRPPTSCQNT